ncbi:hypothetical protein L837_2135 [Mycobacterium avium MAV_061107_1842]|nr:hypothetical protein L837_2135 [Mycobacterium avium MAV_061107_1842]
MAITTWSDRFSGSGNASVRVSRDIAGVTEFTELPLEKTGVV